MAYLYRHVRLDKNEPFYIGIGKNDDDGYIRAYSKKDRNVHWHNVVNVTEYRVEIVYSNIEWKVKKLYRNGIYNTPEIRASRARIASKRFKGTTLKQETKDKISETVKQLHENGAYDEKYKKCSISMLGKNKGANCSSETRKKLSDARRRTITLKNAIRNNENLD